MRKGVSALPATIVIIVVLIIGFIILLGFLYANLSTGGNLIKREGIDPATKNVPCFTTPSIAFKAPKLFWLEPDSTSAYSLSWGRTPWLANSTNISLELSSPCFEDITLYWDFGNGNSTEQLCSYDFVAKKYVDNATGEDCTTKKVNYNFSQIDTVYEIAVDAEGEKSRRWEGDRGRVFVKDPNLRLSVQNVVSAFSCTKATVCVVDSSGYPGLPCVSRNTAGLPSSAFRIFDNNLSEKIEDEDINPFFTPWPQHYYDYHTFDLYYRTHSPIQDKNHSLIIQVTPTLQTAEIKHSYAPAGSTKPELAVFGGAGNIYSEGTSLPSNSILPSGWSGVDFAIGDLDGDGIAEFVFLANNGVDSELFVASYTDLMNLGTYNIKDRATAQILLAGTGWKAVAVGAGIKDSSASRTGNIVVMGNKVLNLYNYADRTINLIESSSQTSSNDDWRDIVAVNLDDNIGDEFIVLSSDTTNSNPPLITEFDTLAQRNVYRLSYNYNWVAVAAGQMDNDLADVEIVALGEQGNVNYKAIFALSHNKYSWTLTEHQINSSGGVGLRTSVSWPQDVLWVDMAATDIDGDGIDDLILEYSPQTGSVTSTVTNISIVDFTNILYTDILANKDTLRLIASSTIALPSNIIRPAVAAGDFACTPGDFVLPLPLSGCTGAISLSLSPNPITLGHNFTATASGLSNCATEEVVFEVPSAQGSAFGLIASTRLGQCYIASGGFGCSINITAPSTIGNYTIFAKIDKEGYTDYTGAGETTNSTLTVMGAKIIDLRVGSVARDAAASTYNLTLNWTAPGAAAYTIPAIQYDLRYSGDINAYSYITTSWDSIPNNQRITLTPQSSGTPETYTINGLDANNVYPYYFAINAKDAAGNWMKSILGYTLPREILSFSPASYSISKANLPMYPIITVTALKLSYPAAYLYCSSSVSGLSCYPAGCTFGTNSECDISLQLTLPTSLQQGQSYNITIYADGTTGANGATVLTSKYHITKYQVTIT